MLVKNSSDRSRGQGRRKIEFLTGALVTEKMYAWNKNIWRTHTYIPSRHGTLMPKQCGSSVNHSWWKRMSLNERTPFRRRRGNLKFKNASILIFAPLDSFRLFENIFTAVWIIKAWYSPYHESDLAKCNDGNSKNEFHFSRHHGNQAAQPCTKRNHLCQWKNWGENPSLLTVK